MPVQGINYGLCQHLAGRFVHLGRGAVNLGFKLLAAGCSFLNTGLWSRRITFLCKVIPELLPLDRDLPSHTDRN